MFTNRDIEAVIIANGDYPTAEYALQVVAQSPLVVCCDGGADEFIARGYTPDIIIGDGDSLSAKNRARFADIIRYEADQQTNDQTKAVKYLLAEGKTRIAIVGATGKRDDIPSGISPCLPSTARWVPMYAATQTTESLSPARERQPSTAKRGRRYLFSTSTQRDLLPRTSPTLSTTLPPFGRVHSTRQQPSSLL